MYGPHPPDDHRRYGFTTEPPASPGPVGGYVPPGPPPGGRTFGAPLLAAIIVGSVAAVLLLVDVTVRVHLARDASAVSAETGTSAPNSSSRITDEDRRQWSDYGARQSRFHPPAGLDSGTQQRQLGQCMGALDERYRDALDELTPLQQAGALMRCLESNFDWTDED